MKIIDLLELLKCRKTFTVFLTVYHNDKKNCFCGTVNEIIDYVLENNIFYYIVCDYLESFSKRTVHVDCFM